MPILFINLTVQVLAALACLFALARLRYQTAAVFIPKRTETPATVCNTINVKNQSEEYPAGGGGGGGGGEWRSDPLTEARTELREVRKELQALKDSTSASKLKLDFITREEFAPIQRIVYGAVGLTLVTVASSILVLIIRTGTVK